MTIPGLVVIGKKMKDLEKKEAKYIIILKNHYIWEIYM